MSATLTRRIFVYACSTLGAAAIVLLGIFCLSSNDASAQSANIRPLAYAGFATEQPTVDVLTTHVAKKKAASQFHVYIVRPGDTLSIISKRFYKKAKCWPVIYNANKKALPNPNQISAGERLTIPRTYSVAACHAPPGFSTATDTSSTRRVMPATGRRIVHTPVRHDRVSAPATGTYHGGGTLSCSGLEALWVAAGGSRAAAFMAAEIAMAESGGNQYAHSPSDDYGYWQINGGHGPAMATYNAMGNARAAVVISSNGSNWNPWTTYRTGAYQGRC